eukprot:3245361-Rhodomonas_salina.4
MVDAGMVAPAKALLDSTVLAPDMVISGLCLVARCAMSGADVVYATPGPSVVAEPSSIDHGCYKIRSGSCLWLDLVLRHVPS